MKKKLLAGAITLSVATGSLFWERVERQTLSAWKDVITEHQFYEQVKNNPSAQQVLLNDTSKKFFEKQYGSELDDKRLMILLPKKKQYGENYNVSCLKQVILKHVIKF